MERFRRTYRKLILFKSNIDQIIISVGALIKKDGLYCEVERNLIKSQ